MNYDRLFFNLCNMGKLVNEFKEFVMKGNVLDMAVGIIIGAAFNKIVNSLVNDIIMPPIGYAIGGKNFTELKAFLDAEQTVSINYGNFIQEIINFFIIALSVFVVVKVVNKMAKMRKENN